ncbi:MAG: hypothetical protein JRF04_04925 [Deltaproteobacteria bacterium]|nr:hypothetical protein [Deltaproteobacteria bacterium]
MQAKAEILVFKGNSNLRINTRIHLNSDPLSRKLPEDRNQGNLSGVQGDTVTGKRNILTGGLARSHKPDGKSWYNQEQIQSLSDRP